MLARHIPRVTSRAVRRPLSSASAVQVEPSFIEAERPSVNVHQVAASRGMWDIKYLGNQNAALPMTAYPYIDSDKGVVNLERHREAMERVKSWEEYEVTPIVSLPHVAQACGVESVHVKVEGSRCGLGSFKALGGGMAVDILASKWGGKGCPPTVTTASAGNHGIAVAWGAARCGLPCVVYVGKSVGPAVAAKIESYGATVVRVDGSYDDSVTKCSKDSEEFGWNVLQDVDYEGYEEIPKQIFQGYTIVAEEMINQLGDLDSLPTHAFVNAGVGGFASAMCGHLWERLGEARPRFVCIEPSAAPSLMAAKMAGEVVSVTTGDTLQTGLNCGEAAPLAWELLEQGVNDFVTINDDCVAPVMQLLAAGNPSTDTPPIVSGCSAVAGLGTLLASARNADLRAALGLDSRSRVAIVLCETAVEPSLFHELVGISVDDLAKDPRTVF